jgi:hypothetical protein
MKLISLLSFFFLWATLFSQQENKLENISGHVFELNEKGSMVPLIGVNIYYLGVNTGTSSDANGFFSLSNNPKKKYLIFSYIGYNTDTLEIKPDKEINVVII